MAQATDNPITPSQNACEPAHTRRSALGFFAKAFGAATVISAPTVAEIVQTATSSEAPALIAAGETLTNAVAAYDRAVSAKQAARAAFEGLAPALPDALIFNRGIGNGAQTMAGSGCDPSPFNWCGEQETDVEDHAVHLADYVGADGKTCAPPDRYIFTADKLRRHGLPHVGGPRSKRGRELRRRLKVAERYEAAYAAARDASGIGEAIEAAYFAAVDVTAAASAVYQIEAQSIVGLAIKARAFSAVERLDKRDCVMHAGTCFGPDLAANVARVLG